MEKILLVVHAFIAVLLVFVILLQKSNTDSLKGIGGGDGGFNSLFSASDSSSFLSKTTVILAIAFMVNCLILSNISSHRSSKAILDKLDKNDKIEQTTNTPPVAE